MGLIIRENSRTTLVSTQNLLVLKENCISLREYVFIVISFDIFILQPVVGQGLIRLVLGNTLGYDVTFK